MIFALKNDNLLPKKQDQQQRKQEQTTGILCASISRMAFLMVNSPSLGNISFTASIVERQRNSEFKMI